ncbi:Exocyst complex component EXO84C [Sesamum alatum]|uniref:Exocyst complex component EXO84C n=1 Tax=Sesamum alatum TaxID=300844 RepID=A0AAE1XVL9_9LAMI|nr:Exocyst complex component EXO84C [Sesamum alatum]
MDSTSTAPRFRFRDHNQETGDDESPEGHTSSDSLSLLSSEDEEPEFQSMTAKGVQYLCSELLELKQESDEDFQKNIFSNYSAFLAILKEIEGLESELLGLKGQASAQKRLVKYVSDIICIGGLSGETVESILEEDLDVQPSSPSLLEIHTEKVSDILDTLLVEHSLDDAVAVLEMEGEFVQDLLSGENVSTDQLTSYRSAVSEKRAMLADQLTLMAKHPRVSAPELQKALSGLCRLGENDLAIRLMLQYYHSRIASGVYNLQSSKDFPDMLYIQELAKFVCSMISQAVRSFVALHGETYPYPSELTQWASEEVEFLAACLKKYIESISEINGRLSTAVDAMQTAMSYCSLLETQRIFLQPSLVEHVRPCMEDVLQLHIDHLSKVVSIFTATDTWALGRYYVSGILTGRSSSIIDQQPECFFLTNSGRKFVTLLQSVAEDVSPLVALQMESSVLKGMMDLFTAYIVNLERTLTGETDVTDKEGSSINSPESPSQGVFMLANLSTLMQFSSCIIRNIFGGIHQMAFEIDNYLMFVHDIYSRLKACFLDQFISNIFSPDADHESGPEIRISWEGDSRISDLIPSVPYLELYLELKKLEKLAEDDVVDVNWLMNLLREVMDAMLLWMSSKSTIWKIDRENLAEHRIEFMQFVLDTQFLVEIARYGGYLSENAVNVSTDIVSRIEASFNSFGLKPLRDLNDEEWPANAATRALQKLQELHAKESLENQKATTTREESHQKDDGNDSVHNPVTVNALEFSIDTDTEVSRTGDTLIEEVINLEAQSTLYNRELYGEVETEKNELRAAGEKSLETSDKNDSPEGDELSA